MSYLKQSEAKRLITLAFHNAGKPEQEFQMRIRQGLYQVLGKKKGKRGVIASGTDWMTCVSCLVTGLKILKAHEADKIKIKSDEPIR